MKIIINFLDGRKIETFMLSETEEYLVTKDGEFIKDEINSIEFIERGDD